MHRISMAKIAQTETEDRMATQKPDAENSFGAAAYGGENWVPRVAGHGDEIGGIWSGYRVASEYAPLQAVLMHRPGTEIAASAEDAEKALMLAPLGVARAQAQHDGIAQAYREHGVAVHMVDPKAPAQPNQMFCADLCAMTPQGAILARPAGQARAGEEREVARRLADLGIPILHTLTGAATFEGADLMWLDARTAIIGRGHRTNSEAIAQISATLEAIGCEVIAADMPFGTMHLMGMLRIADADLAFCWPRRTPFTAVEALRARGYRVAFPPLADDGASYRAMNFVTLGPRKILLGSGLDRFQAFFEGFGIDVATTEIGELAKAAGNIGCLSSILSRHYGVSG
jgi:N-dimethylarginine dimethylaminohydrolase